MALLEEGCAQIGYDAVSWADFALTIVCYLQEGSKAMHKT